MKELLAKKSLTTVMNRLQGRPASRATALLLSAVAGIAGAVGAYKFLRSGGDEDEDESDSEGQSESEEESEEESESA